MTHRSISLSEAIDAPLRRMRGRASLGIATAIALAAGLCTVIVYILLTFRTTPTDTAAPAESEEVLTTGTAAPEAEPLQVAASAEAPSASLGSVVSDGIHKLIAIGRKTLGFSSPPSAAPETPQAPATAAPRRRTSPSPALRPEIARKEATEDAITGSNADVSAHGSSALEEAALELLPTVYSDSDARVTPPIFERPQLPTLAPPSVPASEVGVLELLVTETGEVEKVHLISPANRYRERMLVAAAKAWRFKPATLGGRPVKYRTTVRITL